MNWKILTFLAAAVGSVTGLTLGAMVWTVQTWAPPERPVLYLGVAMLLLFLLGGVLWFQTTRAELQADASGASNTKSLERLLGMGSLVLLGVLGLGVAGLWLSPDVRASVIPYAAAERAQLELALQDPDSGVRETACLALIGMGVDRSEKALAAGLDPYPKAALACLKEARERKMNGTTGVARNLAAGWEAQLMSASSLQAERACAVVPYVSAVRELSGQHPHAGVLECALTAASNDIRACCAAAIGASDSKSLADILGPAESFPAKEGERIFTELVQNTFRPLALPLEQQSVSSKLRADAETSRRWAVAFGCSLVPDPDYRRAVVEGMLPIIEGGTCALSEAAQFAFLETTQWVFLCEDILLETDVPAEEAVCDAFTNSLVERAVAEAQARMKNASRARFLSDAAEELEQPYSSGGGGGSSDKVISRHDLVYDIVGRGTHSGSAPPPGAMCNETVAHPSAFASDTGNTVRLTKRVVPCSSISNPAAGFTYGELAAENMRRINEILGGDADNAVGDERRKEMQKEHGRGNYGKASRKASKEIQEEVRSQR